MKWLLLILIIAQTVYQIRGSVIKKKVDEQLKTYFENAPQNVFASAGQNVLLPCRVRHLNDKVVLSWIRMRDLHILTSGPHLFTNDGRFGIQHPLRDSAIWNLQIKDVSPKDMGSYECQVNTEPKIKFLVNLTVFESDVMIGDMGEASFNDGEQQSDTVDQQQKTSNYEPLERRMTPGGSITFTCRIGLIDQGRQSILWYHDDKLISILRYSNCTSWAVAPKGVARVVEGNCIKASGTKINDRRGSLSVETDRSSNFFASRLTLASVTRSDSGKYTCKSGNTNSTTFTLHVISPANGLALQDGLKSKGSRNYQHDYVISMIIFNFIACSIFVFKLPQ